jgi:PAS domain S-box-containing protein
MQDRWRERDEAGTVEQTSVGGEDEGNLSPSLAAGTRPELAQVGAESWAARVSESPVAVDGMPDALVVIDARGHIGAANVEAESLLGYDRGALIGQPVGLLIPDRSRPAFEAHLQAFVVAPRVMVLGASWGLCARHRSGRELPVAVIVSPDPSGSVLVVVHPVAAASARTADAYVVSVAHDLKGPLSLIGLEARRLGSQL